MPTLYIAGPVCDRVAGVKSGSLCRHDIHAHIELYEFLRKEVESLGWQLIAPDLEPWIDVLNAADFTSAIFSRIDRCEGVVTVALVKNDCSVCVEAARGSFLGKKQLLIADKDMHIPRLLEGLPYIIETVDYRDCDAIRRGLRRLTGLDELEPIGVR